MSIFLKDPGSMVEHVVDWDAGYLAGRNITASVWEVSPAGLTLSAARLAGGRAMITLGAGEAGRLYRVSNRVTLSDGSNDERTLVVRVEER